MTNLYRHYDNKGILLYVGISLSAVARLCQHRDHSQWFKDISKVTIEKYEDRKTALLAEKEAIRKEKPTWNIKHNLQKTEEHNPFKRKDALLAKQTELATALLDERIVGFNAVYSVAEVADLLRLSKRAVGNLLLARESRGEQASELGFIILDAPNGGPRRVRITGWQLIEYLEHKQQETKGRGVPKTGVTYAE